MAVSIATLERGARYLMGVVAILAAAGLGAFKMGWISSVPSYKENAWYLVGGNSSVVITSEYADEATCRRKESVSSLCYSGKAMKEKAQAYPNNRS